MTANDQKHQIQITKNFDLLARQGGEEYAAQHVGKTYTPEGFDADGWALIIGASFHPCTFERLNKSTLQNVTGPGVGLCLGVSEHIRHRSGRMKTVCTSAVLAHFGISPDRYHYSHSSETVTNVLRRNRWAVRSRKSALKVGRGKPQSVGQVRASIRKLNAPNSARFYVSVRGHAMLLDNEGRTIVDTAPRKRDRRPVLNVSIVDRQENLIEKK